MRGFSRLIVALGGLLVIAGILGPIIGFPDVGIFPGVVLLFFGRIMSKQAAGSGRTSERVRPAPQRVLNTDRKTRPAPPPPPRRQPPPRPPEPKQEPEPIREEVMLESILLAGSSLADQKEREEGEGKIEELELGEIEAKQPMSSQEMISEARKRWGHRP